MTTLLGHFLCYCVEKILTNFYGKVSIRAFQGIENFHSQANLYIYRHSIYVDIIQIYSLGWAKLDAYSLR